jgi:uncharacterized ferritin-like protein (DUF455 family)
LLFKAQILPLAIISNMDIRLQALKALETTEIEQKVLLVGVFSKLLATNIIANDCTAQWPEPPHLPGRPLRPELCAHLDVPQRSPHTPSGLAGLVHAVAHIEFNAINLALDAVWRFAGTPERYYTDWLRVAAEEAHHFSLLRAQLQSMGFDYGDFPAHTGLWDMVERTKNDIVARMALVPRTLEARGLDATPPMQTKLRKVGTPAALQVVDILDVILRDEVGHVAIGNHWYRWLCEQRGLDPVAHYRLLAQQYQAPRLRPPFNTAARQAAGFTDAELQALLAL